MDSGFTVAQIEWLYKYQTDYETYTGFYDAFVNAFTFEFHLETFKNYLRKTGLDIKPARAKPLLMTQEQDEAVILYMYEKLLNGKTSLTLLRRSYNKTHTTQLTQKQAAKYYKQALTVYNFHTTSVPDKDVEWLSRYYDCLNKITDIDDLIINALRGAFVQSDESKTTVGAVKIPTAVEKYLSEGGFDPELLALIKHQKSSKNVDIAGLERVRVSYVALAVRCLEKLPIGTKHNPIPTLKDKGYTVTRDEEGNITGAHITETISASLAIPDPQNPTKADD